MAQEIIDQLIVNSPFEEPKQHWSYSRQEQGFELIKKRRPAGYWRATGRVRQGHDDPGEFIEIPLVNKIRPRVKKWRADGYPNTTGVTRKLLRHWYDPSKRSDNKRLFWCNLEAVETAIWLVEASPADKQGIDIPKDVGDWQRQCLKLATGSGKTLVMAMIISWQALNKLSHPKDDRFSKNIVVIAPGITVRDRLQVLLPDNDSNFYQEFEIVDSSLLQDLYRAKIVITNWHQLAPIKKEQGPKVIKKGEESDEAFTKRVLPDFGTAKNILIINDEAHHCHRPSEDEEKKEKEKATVWVSGIDRIHRARGVITAYDLTATPFKPTSNSNQSERLFSWIICDFSLNDAIESGLVKTPRIAVRDDSGMTPDLKSRLFHIYEHVKDDLNRRAEEKEGLPDLVRNAINILGADWLKTKDDWEQSNIGVPPVMIMIANRIETAARLKYSLTKGHISVDELGEESKLLRIDQEALDKLESEQGDKLSKSKEEIIKLERDKFNTVGKKSKPGQDVQCVIGVNMLSEGWDTRTVKYILGLRAFTSQLLCEQVVGRGLRRISYEVDEETGMFKPEYVTVFGIPFTFLPIENDPGKPKIEKPKTKIEPIEDREDLIIDWPHVLRVDYKLKYYLDLDWDKLTPLTLSPEDAPTVVETAPVVDNKPRYDQIKEMDLDKLADDNRLQKLKFQAAARLHEQFGKNWPGDPGSHISQLIQIVDKFLASDKLQMKVPIFAGTEKLKNIIMALNLQKIITHIYELIRSSSEEEPTAIFDSVRPKRSTATAPVWYTSKPTQPIKKSQISHIVVDSSWEAVGFEFERSRIPNLVSWVKNDHLGFEIYYIWEGQPHPYYPDFIVKFKDNRYLILEVKGQQKPVDKAKWQATEEWVKAVNLNGKFGTWEFKVLKNKKDLFDIVK
jgi:type III restriction enzyme